MDQLFPSLIGALLSALPLIAAAIVPPTLAYINAKVGEYVPRQFYPILLPIAGALVAGISKALGLDIGDFNPDTADLSMWETVVAGILVGSASVGLHQIPKQMGKSS